MAEDLKTFSKNELMRYFNSGGFTDELELQTAFAQIKMSEVLLPFLETMEGRILCASIVKDITGNMRKIISCSVDGFDKNIDEIKQAALAINAAHVFMMGIVKILDRAEDCRKAQEQE